MISKTECEKELWHAEHDTDAQFEERLLAGEITYFDPYLDMHRPTSGKFGSRAYTVAQHGFAVDEIIRMRKTSRYMMAEVLIEELIKYGHAKEHYEEWATRESKNIQRELAKNGYCLDTLLRVGEGDIQWAIAKYNPEHTLNYLKTKLDDSKHASGLELVMDQVNPEPKVLEYLLEREAHSTRHELAILEGKLYCGTHEPTPLEKTMTDYELYQSGSVWWMRDLTGNNVASVYSGAAELGGKLTESDFRNLSKLSDDWDVTNYLEAREEHYGNNGQYTSQSYDPIW